MFCRFQQILEGVSLDGSKGNTPSSTANNAHSLAGFQLKRDTFEDDVGSTIGISGELLTDRAVCET